MTDVQPSNGEQKKVVLTLEQRIANLREQLTQAVAHVHGLQGALSVLEEMQRDEAAANEGTH